MNTPTPRTDDAINWHKGVKYVEVSFTRKLERELTAVTEQRDEWGNLWADLSRSCVKDLTKLERKLTAVTEQRDKLAEALNKMISICSCKTEDIDTVNEIRDFVDTITKHSNF